MDLPYCTHLKLEQEATHGSITSLGVDFTFDDVTDAETVSHDGSEAEEPQRWVATVAACSTTERTLRSSQVMSHHVTYRAERIAEH